MNFNNLFKLFFLMFVLMIIFIAGSTFFINQGRYSFTPVLEKYCIDKNQSFIEYKHFIANGIQLTCLDNNGILNSYFYKIDVSWWLI